MTSHKTAAMLVTCCFLSCSVLARANENSDASEPAKGQATSAGPIERTGNAIERGAKATTRGVKRGANAVFRGIKRGAGAVARGVEHGAQATGNTAHKIGKKISGSDSGSSTDDKQ